MKRYLTLFHTIAFLSTALLIVLGGAWERYLAPLRPQGSFLSLKILPLLPLLWGIMRGHRKAFEWSVLVIWLYVMEGLTRLKTDTGLSQQLALIELILALCVFGCCTLWIRCQKPAAMDSLP
jgi:uncharacterized membrane protein